MCVLKLWLKELQSNLMNHLKYFGSDKYPVVLKLPYITDKLHIIERIINEVTRKTYLSVNPRIIFISKSMLASGGKDLVQQKDKIGNPLAPTLANLFMGTLETKLFNTDAVVSSTIQNELLECVLEVHKNCYFSSYHSTFYSCNCR